LVEKQPCNTAMDSRSIYLVSPCNTNSQISAGYVVSDTGQYIIIELYVAKFSNLLNDFMYHLEAFFYSGNIFNSLKKIVNYRIETCRRVLINTPLYQVGAETFVT
jgi:hypothetical protein